MTDAVFIVAALGLSVATIVAAILKERIR